MIRLGCELIAVLGSALLLLAACYKLGSPRSALLAPLTALGVPTAYAAALPVPLGLTELGAAVAIVFERGRLATVLVTLLATLFLGAGVVSLRKGLDVACHCLGSDRGRLGWHQVAAFPFWLVIAGLPFLPGFSSASGLERWLAFLAVVTLVSGVLCYRLAQPVLAARALRIAIGPVS
jgi:hypothetical protein